MKCYANNHLICIILNFSISLKNLLEFAQLHAPKRSVNESETESNINMNGK